MMTRAGLFVDDDEIIKRLGLPDDIGRTALRELDKHGKFVARDALFGNRRFWPAVLDFFMKRYGVAERQGALPDAATWEENFDACKPAARKTNRPASQGFELAQAKPSLGGFMGGKA